MHHTSEPSPHRFIRARFVRAALAFGLPCLSIQAADNDAAESIRVQGKSKGVDARQYDTAGTIVVHHDELIKEGGTEIAAVLKRLPGVTVDSRGAVSLRGLANGYTQVLVDGEMMPPDFTLDALSPELVERVEISRAASADSNGQAVAGTINIILRHRPAGRQRTVATTQATSAALSAPSVTLHLADRPSAAWALDGTLGREAIRHSLVETDIGTDAQGNRTTSRQRDISRPVDTSSLSLSPTLQFGPNDGNAVTLTSLFKASHAIYTLRARSQASLGEADLHAFDAQYNRSDQLHTSTAANWSLADDDGGKLDLKLELVTAQRNTTFREQGADTVDKPNLDAVVFSHASKQGLIQAGKYLYPAAGAHAVSVGWHAALTHQSETRDEYAQGFSGVPAIASADAYQAQTHAFAVFAQDDWQASTRLSLLWGLRWEWLLSHSTGDTFATVDNHGDTPCPTVQGVWKFAHGMHDQLRFALAQSINSPTVAKLIPRVYTSTNNSPVDPDTAGNPQLRPEIAVGPDLAYEIFPSAGATFSLGGYARRIRHHVRPDLTFLHGRWLQQPINAGTAHTWGLEFDAKLPARLLWPAARIDLAVNLTRNWSSVSSVPGPSNQVEDQVPFSGTLTADYTSVDGKFALGASWSHQGGSWQRISSTQFAASARRDEVAVYGAWKPTAGTHVKLALANLRHQDWADVAGYTDADGTRSARRIEPSHAELRATLEIPF